MRRVCDESEVSIYHRSLNNEVARSIYDRIAYILVRDGIPRAALEAAVPIDKNRPFYEQTRPPFIVLHEVAVFLGVSTDWLISGIGRNTREAAPAYDQCAVVLGAQADSINVYNITR